MRDEGKKVQYSSGQISSNFQVSLTLVKDVQIICFFLQIIVGVWANNVFFVLWLLLCLLIGQKQLQIWAGFQSLIYVCDQLH